MKTIEMAKEARFGKYSYEAQTMFERFAELVLASQPAQQEPVANASAWFALVMNAAAELEDASNCLRDEDAKRVAIRGAKYYRDAANALYTSPPLAQQQEPVAWVNQANLNSAAIQRNRGGQGDTHTWSETPTAYHPIPLYTSPQPSKPWVGLTEDEVGIIAMQSQDGVSPCDDTLRFARALEAKLKEKNA